MSSLPAGDELAILLVQLGPLPSQLVADHPLQVALALDDSTAGENNLLTGAQHRARPDAENDRWSQRLARASGGCGGGGGSGVHHHDLLDVRGNLSNLLHLCNALGCQKTCTSIKPGTKTG